MRSKALTHWAAEELHEEFSEQAQRENLSSSALLGRLIADYLEAKQKKGPKRVTRRKTKKAS